MNDVLFQSNNFLLLNKAPRVHYDQILTQGTSDGWLPAHRLDFETSGVIIFTKQEFMPATRALFSESGRIKKYYLAGASAALGGSWECSAQWRAFSGIIAGRYRSSKRVSFFETKAPSSWHSSQNVKHEIRLCADKKKYEKVFSGILHEVLLVSGARHQIRAFFEYAGAALVGDPIYNKNSQAPRLELHAAKLEFISPFDNSLISVEAPLK